jgi:hypothetical protein
MRDLHWRWNFNTGQFDFVENNPRQHYEPLLKHVHRPTLVIDIGLVDVQKLSAYANRVVETAQTSGIRFDQIVFDSTLDPMLDHAAKAQILDQFARSKGIKTYLSVGRFSVSTHPDLVEIIYPSWLFVFKKQALPGWQNRQRTHAFSCLNRRPSSHRLLLYTKIKQRGLLDRFIYSFYDRCPYHDVAIRADQYRDLAKMTSPEQIKLCLENLRDFPISWQEETLGENDHTINHAAYTASWCNIVTETSDVEPFTSEKIWKPIAAGQLFLIAGSQHTAAWLRGLGFHTFDDHYDSEIDLDRRLEIIVDTVYHYRDHAADWWHSNRFHIEHNYHWFHSGNVEKNLLDPIIKQLNHKY